MEKENQVTVSQSNSPLAVFASQDNFNTCWTMAKVLAGSTIVPQTFQNNVGNCLIAIELAGRINTSPLMIMQNLYIVKGNPTFSSIFLIACINTSKKFSTPLRYEWQGEEGKDSWGCRAYAIDKSGEVLKGSWITIGIAKKEGWYEKAGSKWKTMPEQMLRYRAASFFQRTYCPEISVGLSTREEIEDAVIVDAPTPQGGEEAIQQEIDNNANTETLDINAEAPQAAAEPTPKKEETEKKTEPMGKQPTPDFFNE